MADYGRDRNSDAWCVSFIFRYYDSRLIVLWIDRLAAAWVGAQRDQLDLESPVLDFFRLRRRIQRGHDLLLALLVDFDDHFAVSRPNASDSTRTTRISHGLNRYAELFPSDNSLMTILELELLSKSNLATPRMLSEAH